MKSHTALILVIGAVALLASFGKSHAFEVPFDWSCNAAGTHCRAPGLQPRAAKFPSEFHKKYNFPKEIVVENKADYDAVASGWTKRGNCEALPKTDFPEVDNAKIKYCLFWQKGYAAPMPKITKGW